MDQDLPLNRDRESLLQLSREELVDLIIEQETATQELKKTILKLEQEVQKLKVSRDLDSKSSSKPPSGEILKKSENKKERGDGNSETRKRKPGGQPGHPGKTRKGFARVDRLEILRPQYCSCCGSTGLIEEPIKIETQQVAQLVERPIEIVEYHRHTCVCSSCGNLQAADWSIDIVPGQDIGIRLQAFLGWINNYGHLPYEKQRSDDYCVYNGYEVKAQQKCLAHLRRHFKKLIKLPGLNNLEIGKIFVKLIDEAFKNYGLCQRNQDLREFFSWASGFKSLVESSINQWIGKAGGEAGKLLRSLRDKADQWWYFLDHPEIPPDNNLAERTLRLAVTKRKVSGGSRSMERFKNTANLLTVVQTCRRQGRSVIEFFVQAIKAMVNPSVQAASLIPQL